jgi:hypothetical protein
MRITDQYLWNFVFTVIFIGFVFMGMVILEGSGYKTFDELTLTDFVLMTLASFRLIRLVVYDKITAFFREQFYDAEVTKMKVVLVKPESGPRRTLADLLSCPWCFGVWASATVVFFYMLTPWSVFPIIFLALAGVASFFQILSNLIGWKAEQLKIDVESR